MQDIKGFLDDIYSSREDFSELIYSEEHRNNVKKYFKDNNLNINWVDTSLFKSNEITWEVKSLKCKDINEDLLAYYYGFKNNFRLLSVYCLKFIDQIGDFTNSYHMRFAIDDHLLINNWEKTLEEGRRIKMNMEQW